MRHLTQDRAGDAGPARCLSRREAKSELAGRTTGKTGNLSIDLTSEGAAPMTLARYAKTTLAFGLALQVAIATQTANQTRGCCVIPDEIVNPVRPPGMKRAVIRRGPPRLRIWRPASSSRCARTALRSAQARTRGSNRSPIREPE